MWCGQFIGLRWNFSLLSSEQIQHEVRGSGPRAGGDVEVFWRGAYRRGGNPCPCGVPRGKLLDRLADDHAVGLDERKARPGRAGREMVKSLEFGAEDAEFNKCRSRLKLSLEFW